jgi:hypothetical protein
LKQTFCGKSLDSNNPLLSISNKKAAADKAEAAAFCLKYMNSLERW